MAQPTKREKNALFGLFTRSEDRKGRIARAARKRHRSLKHQLKGAARARIGKIMGIPLNRDVLTGKGASSRRTAHRTTALSSGSKPSTSVRSDVISALRGQGYNAGTAKKMAEGVRDGDTFESAFRRVISRNPGELIIFGNPSMVYTREGLTRTNRAGNPIPAAIVSAFESAFGSKLFDTVTSGGGRKKNFFGLGRKGATRESVESRRDAEAHSLFDQGKFRQAKRTKKKSARKFAKQQGIQMEGALQRGKRKLRKKLQKKASSAIGRLFNPDEEQVDPRARQLFETFHHRSPAGTFDRQRSARLRKDYTVLGVLVAIGINAEKFDSIAKQAGRGFQDWAVENYDRLPRLDFMTPGQVEQVKTILGDPSKYVQDAPLLASSPSGRQLYALAEDVQLDLSKFETDTQKDYVDLGDATFVVYIAKKPDEVREWVHIMGEDGGTRPRLMYDRLRKEVCFIGGSYVVKAPGIMH